MMAENENLLCKYAIFLRLNWLDNLTSWLLTFPNYQTRFALVARVQVTIPNLFASVFTVEQYTNVDENKWFSTCLCLWHLLIPKF